MGYHLEQAVLYRGELGLPERGLAERAGERLGAAAEAPGSTRRQRGGWRLLVRAMRLLGPTTPEEVIPDLALAYIDLGRLGDAQTQVDVLAAAEGDRWRAYASAIRPRLDALSGRGSYEAARAGVAEAEETFRRLGDERGSRSRR